MENKIIEISKILGVSAESINELPPDTINSMMLILENIEVRNDDDRKMLYNELEKYWINGGISVILKEISEKTGIVHDALCNLDFNTKLNVVLEYTVDANFTNIYKIVNNALAVIELEKVSSLIDVPFNELKKLPNDIQEKICGHYAMEYDENGDNAALVSVLKGLVDNG